MMERVLGQDIAELSVLELTYLVYTEIRDDNGGVAPFRWKFDCIESGQLE